MPTIQLPPDGSGQYIPAIDVPGVGPGGATVAYPLNIVQQNNGVGPIIHVQLWGPMPTGITVLSAVQCAIDVLWFNNAGGSTHTIYVDDGDGNTILGISLTAGQSFPWPLYGLPAAGLRWQASDASVNGAARWFAAS